MSEVIKAMGKPPLDVLFELLTENGGSVPDRLLPSCGRGHAIRAQAAVRLDRLGRQRREDEGPLAAGNPHPRYYGTFPRVLGRYVREEKLISLEEAVRKMTSANAAKIRIYDRGLLRPGQWADVTVFNPDTHH